MEEGRGNNNNRAIEGIPFLNYKMKKGGQTVEVHATTTYMQM